MTGACRPSPRIKVVTKICAILLPDPFSLCLVALVVRSRVIEFTVYAATEIRVALGTGIASHNPAG